MRLIVGIAACLALCQPSSPASAAEKFARKYTENSKIAKETESKVEQTLTVAGMAVETKAITFIDTTATAGTRDADGNLAVEETVTSLRASLELPMGIKLSFDSADPDKKAEVEALNAVLDIYRTILKTPTTAIIDRDNKVQEVKLDAAALEKLPKENRSSLDPARQKRDREQAWLFLPDAEVEPGAEWERYIDRDLTGGQTMNFKMKYSYVGPETNDGKTLHKFSVKHEEVTYALDPTANPMVQVPKSDLKIAKSSGTILYDPATGDTPLRESTVKITGTLTLVINGAELPSDLDLTLTETTKAKK